MPIIIAVLLVIAPLAARALRRQPWWSPPRPLWPDDREQRTSPGPAGARSGFTRMVTTWRWLPSHPAFARPTAAGSRTAASSLRGTTTHWHGATAARGPSGRRGGRGLLVITGIVVMSAIAFDLAQESPLALLVFGLYWFYQAGQALARGWRQLGRSRGGSFAPTLPGPATWIPPGAGHRVAPEAILRALGYQQVKRLPGRGEMGMDFVACDEQRQTVLVHVLPGLPAERTTSDHIAALIAAAPAQQMVAGVAITHGVFTPAAINLARHSRVPITLYDGTAVRAVTAPVRVHRAA